MSTDLYAPSLPYLTEHFSTTAELMKLTISLNLIIYGFAQLLFGPMSDRFGRRPVFLWSIALFSLASVACAFAKSIDQLLLARVLQGFFAAAEAVICLAVFKDLFTEQEQVKGFAIYGSAIALTPAIAPILGGYIHIYLGWEYNFYLIAVVGVLTAFMIFYFLPESTTPDPQALKPKLLIQSYIGIFVNRTFMIYGLITGIALGFIYAFVTAAPFILINYFDVPIQHFGYYQAVIVALFFLGSLLSTKLIDHWDPMTLFNFGIAFVVFGATSLVYLIYSGALSPNTLVFANSMVAFGIGPIFAVAPSKAMGSVEKSAGSAAAVFGSLEIGLSGVIATVVSIFHDDTPRPYAIVVGCCAITVFILCIIANKMSRDKPR